MRYGKIYIYPEGKSDISWLLYMVTKIKMILSNFFLWLANIIDQKAQNQFPCEANATDYLLMISDPFENTRYSGQG